MGEVGRGGDVLIHTPTEGQRSYPERGATPLIVQSFKTTEAQLYMNS